MVWCLVLAMPTSTGIDELDALLGGGFPQGSLIILAGNPGTGKTAFSAQFLYRGAVDHGENGIYVSFAESKEAFFENMRGFGFDFAKLEQEGRFCFLDLLTVKEQEVPSILNMILAELSKAKAKRLVLDSFSALAQSFKDPIEIRMIVHTILSKIIRVMGCTSIIIEEVPFGSSRIGFGIEEFVADGVIHLKTSELENIRIRELEILKLRGVKLKDTRMIFTLDGGFKAFIPFQIKPIEKPNRFQPIPNPPNKYSTGSKSFDEALGGGIPRGSVMLLEIDEKVSAEMYYMLVSVVGANFLAQNNGVVHIPSISVDPIIVKQITETYGAPDSGLSELSIVVFENFNVPLNFPKNLQLLQIEGKDWKKDFNEIYLKVGAVSKKTGVRNLYIVGVDTLINRYGEKQAEEMLSLGASMVRLYGSAAITILKPGIKDFAVKLSSIADIHLRLTRKHGSLIIYGVKPRTGLYAVEPDVSMGYPVAKLTPIL